MSGNPGHDDAAAEYIAFEAFRDGLPHGQFRVIVNPELARRYVPQRLHATPLAVAIIGPGIALALAGHPVAGLVLVALGIVLRRVVRAQAPQILLHLSARVRAIYDEATAHGVMEVQRAPQGPAS